MLRVSSQIHITQDCLGIKIWFAKAAPSNPIIANAFEHNFICSSIEYVEKSIYFILNSVFNFKNIKLIILLFLVCLLGIIIYFISSDIFYKDTYLKIYQA